MRENFYGKSSPGEGRDEGGRIESLSRSSLRSPLLERPFRRWNFEPGPTQTNGIHRPAKLFGHEFVGRFSEQLILFLRPVSVDHSAAVWNFQFASAGGPQPSFAPEFSQFPRPIGFPKSLLLPVARLVVGTAGCAVSAGGRRWPHNRGSTAKPVPYRARCPAASPLGRSMAEGQNRICGCQSDRAGPAPRAGNDRRAWRPPNPSLVNDNYYFPPVASFQIVTIVGHHLKAGFYGFTWLVSPYLFPLRDRLRGGERSEP